MKPKLTEIMGYMAEKNAGISRSDNVVSVQIVKAGGLVKMGVSDEIINKIINDEVYVLLFTLDKKEYQQIIKEKSNINE